MSTVLNSSEFTNIRQFSEEVMLHKIYMVKDYIKHLTTKKQYREKPADWNKKRYFTKLKHIFDMIHMTCTKMVE